MNERKIEGNPEMFRIDHRPISQAQLIAFAGLAVTIAVQSFALGVGYWDLKEGQDNAATKTELQAVANDVEEMERYRVSRSASTDRQFDQLRVAVEPINGLRFVQEQTAREVAEQKNQLVETNKRVDRMVELLGGKLDSLNDSVNTIKSDVRLLSSKLDDQNGRNATPRRTKWSVPMPEPLPSPVMVR